MDKAPTDYNAITYAWVLLISLIGGMAHYTCNIGNGRKSLFSIRIFLGDMLVSGFAGLMTFYLCEAAELQGQLQAVFVGVAGHMGSRAIFLIERRLVRCVDEDFKE